MTDLQSTLDAIDAATVVRRARPQRTLAVLASTSARTGAKPIGRRPAASVEGDGYLDASLAALQMSCVDGAMPTDLLWRY